MNSGLQFSHPWLLLLFIPALALAFIPYFRLSPKFRRTRNRISSLVLFLLVSFFAVTVLAGMTYNYTIPNEKNEIIILVDVSDTEEQSAELRDDVVETVLRDGSYDNYKIGVVTFGFGEKYVVPLTSDVDGIYDRYLDSLSDIPDGTATDIASALVYTKSLFTNPETGKIVLISDGKETDGKASSVARSIAASGIKIDVIFVPSYYSGMDVQIVGAELPEYHVNKGEECIITLVVQSRGEGFPATITLTDNDDTDHKVVKEVTLIGGLQTFDIPYTFTDNGVHRLDFSIDIGDEELTLNNNFTSYMSIESFNSVLVFERTSGSSATLKSMLEENDAFVVETATFDDDESFIPYTVDELRAFDQVVMNNVSTADMETRWGQAESKEFQNALYSYVNDYGGAVLTVGGDDDFGNANIYSRNYMAGTTYENMLPVKAIDYTPPLGVVIIIDVSGSMTGIVGSSGQSRLDWAKAGALSCLKVMSERDYMAIMTLSGNNETLLELTPKTQESRIVEAIQQIDTADGNTVAANSLKVAGQYLNAEKMIEKKHIIIVSDGEFSDVSEATEMAATNYENGITLSIVQIGSATTASHSVLKAGQGGSDDYMRFFYNDDEQIVRNMREDLQVPEIKAVNMVDFTPVVETPTSSLLLNVDTEKVEGSSEVVLTTTLGGFYGARIKNGAELILTGNYKVPLYAQWKLGKGMVGSFLCDIGGKWSVEFSASAGGRQFIRNAIGNLMPTEDISPKDITLNLKEENYVNQLDVYSELAEGEKIVAEITDMTDFAENKKSLNSVYAQESEKEDGFYVLTALGASNSYTRSTFVVKKSGLYKISAAKVDAEGNEKERVEIYKTFSYSEEYNAFSEETEEDIKDKLALIAARGNGSLIEDEEDPWEVFKDFVTRLDRTFDPRTLFMILAIICFLLDIVVRKFKFKWPHEIVRSLKEKKSKA